jgi:MFS family permease
MQYIRDIDDRLVGTILMISTFIMAFFVNFSGKMSDRVSSLRISAVGIMITSISLALFTSIDSETAMAIVIGALVLLLIGGAFFQPPMVKCVLDSISIDMFGVGSSFVEMMRLVGQTLSMAIVILFFTLYTGGSKITPRNYDAFLDSINTMSMFFFLLCLISLILIILIERSRKTCS